MDIKDTSQDLAFENKEIEVFDINRQANPFGANSVLANVYRKAERVALAVHLVTNSAPETASVKNSVRSQSQEVLLHLLTLPHGFYKKDSSAFIALTAKIRSVLSLLDICHIEGHVSLDHVQLIKRAYIDMLTFLSTSTTEGSAHTTILTTQDLVSSQGNKGHSRTDKGQIKDTKEIVAIKDTKETKNIKKDHSQKRQTPLAQKKVMTNRRMSVIDILSVHPHATLQDLLQKFPGVSGKTIQRELLKLIDDGVVTKEGERRWTTYQLSGE